MIIFLCFSRNRNVDYDEEDGRSQTPSSQSNMSYNNNDIKNDNYEMSHLRNQNLHPKEDNVPKAVVIISIK